MLSPPTRLLELQLPAILDLPAWPLEIECLTQARAAAAGKLSSVAVVPAAEATGLPAEMLPNVAPLLAAEETGAYAGLLDAARLAEVIDSPGAAQATTQLQDAYSTLVVAVRLDLAPNTADRVIELARAGVKVFHVCADRHGRERLDNGRPGLHIKDAVRAIHGRLVKEGLRDEVTLIVGGGIALAEHMAKAIICGADLVAVDTPLLIALGCRVCGGGDLCHNGQSCPAGMGSIELPYATQRLVNLMGAWHSQLIEVLGAMGIREVRRLRGEVGRAIFLEDIEKEAFGDLDRVSPSEVIA